MGLGLAETCCYTANMPTVKHPRCKVSVLRLPGYQCALVAMPYTPYHGRQGAQEGSGTSHQAHMPCAWQCPKFDTSSGATDAHIELFMRLRCGLHKRASENQIICSASAFSCVAPF